jgi:transposase-like protein
MTKEQAQNILDGADGCPKCEGDNISGETDPVGSGFVNQRFHCLDCDYKWSINYTATDCQDNENCYTQSIDWDKVKLIKTTP